MNALEIVLIVSVAVLIGVVVFMAMRKTSNEEVSSSLVGLSQTVQGVLEKNAILSEKLGNMDSKQTELHTDLKTMRDSVAKTEELNRTIVESSYNLNSQFTGMKESIVTLQEHLKARRDLDTKNTEALKRLESIIVGTQTKGVAGENIVETIFSTLPAEMQERNFKVNGKTVEFGLKLPNNLVLPIDSKWPATNLLEEFAKAKDEQKSAIKKQITNEVLKKAGEVQKYIDTSETPSFAVMVVPDSVFELSSSALTEVYRMNVALVSYSMFMPYILMVFHTVFKTSRNIDLEKLHDYINEVYSQVEKLQDELDGRMSKGLTMLSNSIVEMKQSAGKIKGSLTTLQMGGLPEKKDEKKQEGLFLS